MGFFVVEVFFVVVLGGSGALAAGVAFFRGLVRSATFGSSGSGFAGVFFGVDWDAAAVFVFEVAKYLAASVSTPFTGSLDSLSAGMG